MINTKEASMICNSRIWHGPGHQSSTRCRLVGEHEVHEAYYGEFDQFARWTGEENFSGVFDEPPPDPIEEHEAYESIQKQRARIRAEIEQEQHKQRLRTKKMKLYFRPQLPETPDQVRSANVLRIEENDIYDDEHAVRLAIKRNGSWYAAARPWWDEFGPYTEIIVATD